MEYEAWVLMTGRLRSVFEVRKTELSVYYYNFENNFSYM